MRRERQDKAVVKNPGQRKRRLRGAVANISVSLRLLLALSKFPTETAARAFRGIKLVELCLEGLAHTLADASEVSTAARVEPRRNCTWKAEAVRSPSKLRSRPAPSRSWCFLWFWSAKRAARSVSHCHQTTQSLHTIPIVQRAPRFGCCDDDPRSFHRRPPPRPHNPRPLALSLSHTAPYDKEQRSSSAYLHGCCCCCFWTGDEFVLAAQEFCVKSEEGSKSECSVDLDGPVQFLQGFYVCSLKHANASASCLRVGNP